MQDYDAVFCNGKDRNLRAVACPWTTAAPIKGASALEFRRGEFTAGPYEPGLFLGSVSVFMTSWGMI